jgi:hypothetical protein
MDRKQMGAPAGMLQVLDSPTSPVTKRAGPATTTRKGKSKYSIRREEEREKEQKKRPSTNGMRLSAQSKAFPLLF